MYVGSNRQIIDLECVTERDLLKRERRRARALRPLPHCLINCNAVVSRVKASHTLVKHALIYSLINSKVGL